ncbi:MAG TPA: hypothetical protein VKK31_08375 [Thermoanaerobaculia bacterium]|nr:hypothetical protein [Thermoanaerobaculia bacterium]
MRFKAYQGLLAITLLFVSSVAGWAQPDLVGSEFQVNQNRDSNQLKPVVAFSPAGHSLIVWENDLHGIMGRFYDRNGSPMSAEITLVANQTLPSLPASGEISIRTEPALIYLPNGEFLVFWTEERDFVSADYFYVYREIREQDVRGQRFSAAGKPLGASFRVNDETAGFQRRPKAALRAGGVVVVWEGGVLSGVSQSVQGRLLTRRGQAQGGEFRLDSGQAPKVRSLAVAAVPSGQAIVVWEIDHADGPNIVTRFLNQAGAPTGAEHLANMSTAGRQRRPAVLATRDGNFLVAWQTNVNTTPRQHGIKGQFVSSEFTWFGPELTFTDDGGSTQVAPALALLPSGNIVVAWSDWTDTYPLGIYALTVDPAGRPLGKKVALNKDRVYPQYQNSVAANAHGDIVAVWEGQIQRGRAIAGRRLADD